MGAWRCLLTAHLTPSYLPWLLHTNKTWHSRPKELAQMCNIPHYKLYKLLLISFLEDELQGKEAWSQDFFVYIYTSSIHQNNRSLFRESKTRLARWTLAKETCWNCWSHDHPSHTLLSLSELTWVTAERGTFLCHCCHRPMHFLNWKQQHFPSVKPSIGYGREKMRIFLVIL